jgi:hypothetical protein
MINSDLSIQENHQNEDLGAIVSVAIEDDLKHLSKVTGAFIGTRSNRKYSTIPKTKLEEKTNMSRQGKHLTIFRPKNIPQILERMSMRRTM